MNGYMSMECRYCGNTDRRRFILRDGEYVCKCCGRCYRETPTGGEMRATLGFETLKNYDFEGAENIFSDIISEYPESVDARWGLLLARYGIVFVKGFYMGEIEPIYCFPNYSYSKGSFTSEKEYKEIEKLLASDSRALAVYKEQAAQIERAFASFKSDFGKKENDVFICVKISKTTASNPELKGTTADYEKACELYGKLREEGKNVFFSYVTLKNTIDSDMEIWRNMIKSKKMLLIGSCTEYMNSVWVKSEWERWLWLDGAGGEEHKKNFYIYVLGNERTEDLYAKLPAGIKRLRPQIYTESKEEQLIKDICGVKKAEKKPKPEKAPKREKAVAVAEPKPEKAQKGKDGYITFLSGRKEEIPFGLESVAIYSGRSDIVSVVLPQSVTKIKKENFSGCVNLESIEIPKSVTRIEAGAFSGCSKLASAELPDGITEIEPQTFYMCKNLSRVKLPKYLQKIGSGAFMLCTSLKKIKLPGEIYAIDDEAFHSTGLCEVEVPKAVLHLGERVFAVCKKLERTVICDTISSIGADAFDSNQRIIYRGDKEDFDRANKGSTYYNKLVCEKETSVKTHRRAIALSLILLIAMIGACIALPICVPESLHWCIAVGGGLLIAGIANIISINEKNSTHFWLNIIYLVACVVLFFIAQTSGIEYVDPETNTTIWENTALSINLSIYIVGLAASALATGIYGGISTRMEFADWILLAINVFEVGIGVASIIFYAFNVLVFFAGIALVVGVVTGICAIINALNGG